MMALYARRQLRTWQANYSSLQILVFSMIHLEQVGLNHTAIVNKDKEITNSHNHSCFSRHAYSTAT